MLTPAAFSRVLLFGVTSPFRLLITRNRANRRRKVARTLVSSATRYNLPGTHFRLAYVAMMERAEKPSAQIEVIPARSEQEPILANLLELYVRVRQSNLFASRKMAGGGHFSHLSPSVSSNRRNCCDIEDDGRSAFDSCPASPGGIMGITARDAHSSRPLLFETCSTIFVNN
jgi:hypothetical protein